LSFRRASEARQEESVVAHRGKWRKNAAKPSAGFAAQETP